MFKKLLFALLSLILIGVCTGIYLWNKPHKKVEDTKGVTLTAEAISKEYNSNEKAADSMYLNKAIEVTGVVGTTEKNQDGGLLVTLETSDPMAGVQCAMRDTGVTATKGQKITIKGFCSGSLMGTVSLTDCVVKDH